MNEPLDDLYLGWLYSQIGSVKQRRSSRTYWSLLRQLYTKEFIWVIPNDDNRVEDGKELRYEFLDDQRIEDVDSDWMGLGCSMLEMLVALARRFAFEAEGDPGGWFWEIIENLNLKSYNDKSHYNHKEVDEVLDRVIWRTFNSDGSGGLFPLKKAAKDQRKIEIWYQLSSYMLEHGDT